MRTWVWTTASMPESKHRSRHLQFLCKNGERISKACVPTGLEKAMTFGSQLISENMTECDGGRSLMKNSGPCTQICTAQVDTNKHTQTQK